MAEDSVQTYGSHARFLPPWHFFVFPVLLINVVVQIVAAAKDPSLSSGWHVLVAVALTLGIFFSRFMPLRVQDRLIRLEETLRLQRLLPGRTADIERLSLGQLIGLRFASDQEVAHILDRIVAGELTSRADVKRAVQHWRPDHLRV
jgi:hypothetical protein